MNAAIINKKTIVVWNNLSESEKNKLVTTLENIIKAYQARTRDMSEQDLKRAATPIPLDKGKYLTVLHKNGNFVLSTTKTGKNISHIPLLNGDELFEHIDRLEKAKDVVNTRITVLENIPNSKWENMTLADTVHSYLLSPNPNPEDFVESLKRGDLPDMYRKFLNDVGIALQSAEKIDVREDDYGFYR